MNRTFLLAIVWIARTACEAPSIQTVESVATHRPQMNGPTLRPGGGHETAKHSAFALQARRSQRPRNKMDPKIIIIIAVSLAYGSFEVFLNVRQRSKSRVSTSGDKGSLWLLYGLITLGYALSFTIGATRFGRIYQWNILFGMGMAIFVIGLLIRIHSIRTLKQYFTYSVGTVENHHIIEAGLYRYIRHPGYLGQLIIFLGMSVSLSNGYSILVMMLPVAIGYLYRIRIEEEWLSEQLGKDYRIYRERTKKIVPFLY